MKRSTVERVAGVRPVAVEGIFYRHAAVNRDAFAGGLHGRWGAHFPVIYLGRPEAAPVAEAYRHLVEEAGIPAHAVQPRFSIRCAFVPRTLSTLRIQRIWTRSA